MPTYLTAFLPAKSGIYVQEVRVEVAGTFGSPGEPARDISYDVHVRANAP